MHEFGIAENALALVLDEMRRRQATRVHAITMRIGELSGVVEEALTFAFTALSAGTPAEGARLAVETVPIACYCAACAKEFAAKPFEYVCPTCGQPSADIRRGRELHVASIEVS